MNPNTTHNHPTALRYPIIDTLMSVGAYCSIYRFIYPYRKGRGFFTPSADGYRPILLMNSACNFSRFSRNSSIFSFDHS